MNSKPRRKSGAGAGDKSNLRRRALQLLEDNPERLAELPPQDLKSVLHELRVHQIELAMQNQELREARHELELSRAEYASLYDHAPVGYLSLEPDGHILRLNLKAAEILGQPRQQVPRKPLSRFIAEEDRAVFQREFRRARETGGHHVCELRLRKPDGQVSHIYFECQMVGREENGIRQLHVTMTDITRRLRMEEQLHLSRRQLQAALQASRCGIWDWPDVRRDEAWWSPEFYQLLDYENGAIRPSYNTFKSLLHPDDRTAVLKELDDHIRDGNTFDTEFRLRTRGGDYRWFRGHGQILRDGHGRRHMAGLLQDVTDRHRADQELHDAKDRSERADREKSRFLAAASHDLRQPLQSLSLYLNSLKYADTTPQQDEIIDKMRLSVQTMGQLLRTLLNISRLDSGVIAPEPVAFPVRDLFDEILVNHGPSAQVRGLALRVHPSSLVIESDRVLLQEIIQNLVSNALKYTDRGGVLLGCRRRGDRAWIEVRDTGIGIPPDRLSRLFNTNTVEDRNNETIRTGLGLAIVQQIAGLLGCRLDASSTPDRGSCFAVEVPLAPDQNLVPKGMSGGGLQPVHRDGHRVLLIDNDESILDACCRAADAASYHLACAGSREEAVAQIRDGLVPDVIVSDMRLRRVPGTAVIREIRDMLDRDIPAIVLTGDTSLGDDVSGLERCRVLYKPVELETLNRMIQEIASRD